MIKIVAAATRKGGKVFTGTSHGQIGLDTAELFEFDGRPVNANFRGEQGFLTSYGIFVNREEAALIALAAHQIDKLHYFENELDSSDINLYSIDGSKLEKKGIL